MQDSRQLLKTITFRTSALFTIGALLSMLYFDQSVSLYFGEPEFESFRIFCGKMTELGVSSSYFVLSILGYILARWILPLNLNWKNSVWIAKVRWFSGFTFSSLFILGISVQILKGLFGRQRPHLTASYYPFEFEGINFHWHWHSFPSGHSQVSFVIATILALVWPKYRFAFLGLGAFVAFTRIVIHQHFLSDVLVGSAIGYLGTLWIYEILFKKTQASIDARAETNT